MYSFTERMIISGLVISFWAFYLIDQINLLKVEY